MAFLRALLRRGTTIASATPSSRWMCRELCRWVDPKRPQRILELGAGTGVVTRTILHRMHSGSALVAVELLDDFAPFLQRGSDRATILFGCVTQLRERLEAAGPFDLVISGLPFPSLPESARRAVLSIVAAATPGATFSQLTELPMLYRGLYRRYFRTVRFRFVGLNVPPGGVYHCTGARAMRVW